MSTLSVLIFACIFFREFWSISQNFLFNGIRENKYTLKLHKIYISQNTRKKYAQNLAKFLEPITDQ